MQTMRDRDLLPRILLLAALAFLVSVPISCVWQLKRGWGEAEQAAAPFLALGGFVRTSGDGASQFNGAAGLYGVYLREAGIGDDELGRLKGALLRLPNLETLQLDGNEITDAGLVHLADLSRLTHLEDLRLSRTKITDHGLPHLEKLTQLRRLDLTQTAVTLRGVERLKERLPNVEITLGE